MLTGERNSAVFYDPSQRRWRRFKGLVLALGVPSGVVFVVLAASILCHPFLPSLSLPGETAPGDVRNVGAQPGPARTQARSSLAGPFLSHGGQTSAVPLDTIPAPPGDETRPEIAAFYVNWDYNSLTSLEHNLEGLDKLIPEWLHVANDEGGIRENDPERRREMLEAVQGRRSDLAIVPLVNNFDSTKLSWDGALLDRVLSDPAARERLIGNLLSFVRGNGFAGIHVDFENLLPATQPKLVVFMRELYAAFHPLGLEVSQSLPPDQTAYDFQALAESNDYLVLMAYDEYAAGSVPGPIASQAWYLEHLKQRLAELPPGKVVVGIGSYGYDWNGNGRPAEVLSYQDATRIARTAPGEIAFDAEVLNPTFAYADGEGSLHRVWFLDAVTAFNQLVALKTLTAGGRPVRGFALWRLGSEDPLIWDVLGESRSLDGGFIHRLRAVRGDYDLEFRGRGEVMRVTAIPADGVREITYDPALGLVTDQRVLRHPSPYVITRWGGEDPKRIALSFDDGPNPSFTPRVLDLLARHGVSATFFVTGVSAAKHRDLLERMFDDGHEIGNHTFLHPMPSRVSLRRLRAELNASQRLFESFLGRRTLLFRPPYGDGLHPATPGQLRELLVAGELGYYTVGMNVEPDDWRQPGPEYIAVTTLEQVRTGLGNVVLLHDGGGDRSQTLAALPAIIEGLRSDGYELVTISALLGLQRDDVMPLVPEDERVLTGVNGAGFLYLGWSRSLIAQVMLVATILGVARLLTIGALATYQRFRRRSPPQSLAASRSICVVVPAYNEEKVIVTTVSSLLRSTYVRFEVVVVDDGSSDATVKKLRGAFGRDPRVRVLPKARGGKAEALNFAISRTNAEVVVTVDADTLLDPEAIGYMAKHFGDPRVGAVAGNAKVGNRVNLLTYWQAIEYVTSQSLERRGLGMVNAIFVVPGAVGAWRREAILQVGGFRHDTLAEDADLTVTLLKCGYKVRYEERAIGRTEAPDTVRGFVKQRRRWMYGILQTVWKHRDAFLRPRYKGAGLFALPNALIFQVVFALMAPLTDVVIVLALATALWQPQLLAYAAIFLAVDALTSLVAFLLEPGEERRLLVWLPLQRFFYRQLMYYVAIRSVFRAIRGGGAGWGHVERRATMSEFARGG